MSVKIYQYGCHANIPPQTLTLISDQLYRAHNYYNSLVAIERDYREDVSRCQAKHSHELQVATEEAMSIESRIEACYESIRRLKQRERRNIIDTQSAEEIRKLKVQLKDVRQKIKTAKSLLKSNEDYKKDLELLRERLYKRRKELYGSVSDLFWGSKSLCVNRLEAAIRTTPGGIPRFRPWSRDGSIYTQIQYGITAERAYSGQDNRLQIQRVPGAKKLCIVRVRVGSNGRDPVFAELPTSIHRPIPEGSLIMGVTITRRGGPLHRKSRAEVVYADRYYVSLTLRIPEEQSTDPGGVAAIDLGWRKLPDGVRVAYVVTHDRRHIELVLPQFMCDRYDEIESIQSQRDIAFNDARDNLVRYIDECQCGIPESLKEASKTLRNWRSTKRLWWLVENWESHPGDDMILPILRSWAQYELQESRRQHYIQGKILNRSCLLYTSPSPRDS